jgi:hypothetical protein
MFDKLLVINENVPFLSFSRNILRGPFCAAKLRFNRFKMGIFKIKKSNAVCHVRLFLAKLSPRKIRNVLNFQKCTP